MDTFRLDPVTAPENVPVVPEIAAVEDPPITVPSIDPPLISAVVAVNELNVPAAAELAPIVAPSIAPPLMSTLPDVNDVLAVKLVNVPAAGVAPPITELSTVPPSRLAVVIVPRLLTVAPLKLTVPEAVRLVNVPAAAVEAPITVPSMLPPLMSAVGTVTVPVKVGLAVSDFVAIAVDIASNSVSNSAPRTTLLVSPPGRVSLAAKSVVLV